MVELDLVNIGSQANDGTGDPLRTAFDKINRSLEAINNKLAEVANGGPTLAIIFDEQGRPITSDNPFPVSLSGRNLLDDEVIALTGEIQQLTNIPSAATIVRLTVEYTPDASEVGGIRFRELGKDPSVNGEFVAGGESVVIGFTHEALQALRFILVGPGTGRVIAKYY